MDDVVVIDSDYVVDVINEWRIKLNLSHWKIGLRIASAEDPVTPKFGEIEIVDGRFVAYITLYPRTLQSEQQVVETVVHELLHIYSGRIREHMTSLLVDVSADLRTSIMGILYSDVELLTDSLTTTILELDGHGEVEIDD